MAKPAANKQHRSRSRSAIGVDQQAAGAGSTPLQPQLAGPSADPSLQGPEDGWPELGPGLALWQAMRSEKTWAL